MVGLGLLVQYIVFLHPLPVTRHGKINPVRKGVEVTGCYALAVKIQEGWKPLQQNIVLSLLEVLHALEFVLI